MARKIIRNPYKCPVTHSMNVIGGKWKPIIVYLLSKGALRFGKLVMFIPSISRKVLTDQLREMESDGLIFREKFNEIPPRVEYSLTKSGEALIPILYSLAEWSKEFANDLEFESLPE
ncbi:MAG: helix-turn-helix transcriptional regulator [Bacteroidetes bacterium]|nr:helix-turn-helix transcriptional regulator [Bacteroidota bacterium]